MTNIKSFVALGCPHSPLQDPEAVEWLLTELQIRRPDYLIHLGDGHEADAASKFGSEYDFTLQDEFISHNKFLRQLRLACPKKTHKVFCEGNHDYNIRDWNRVSKKLAGLCDYREHEPELTEHWEFGCEYIFSREGTWRLGQVVFGHGYYAGKDADEKMAIQLCDPYGLWIGAHTHSPRQVSRAAKGKSLLPYWYANAGCIRELKPSYMRRKSTQSWGHAIVAGEVNLNAKPGDSREWWAETVVRKNACDPTGDSPDWVLRR